MTNGHMTAGPFHVQLFRKLWAECVFSSFSFVFRNVMACDFLSNHPFNQNRGQWSDLGKQGPQTEGFRIPHAAPLRLCAALAWLREKGWHQWQGWLLPPHHKLNSSLCELPWLHMDWEREPTVSDETPIKNFGQAASSEGIQSGRFQVVGFKKSFGFRTESVPS